jgi:ribose 5-phosphate isomerase RpiB
MPAALTVLPKTSNLLGIAADHGGFELKRFLVKQLRNHGHEVVDFGVATER